MRLRKKKGRCHRKCGNSCIYAETTLETYVKLKICSSSLQHKYEELLKCITPYHSEGDMYKYDFPFKKLFFNSLAVKYIDIRSTVLNSMKRLSFPMEYGNRFDCLSASLLK